MNKNANYIILSRNIAVKNALTFTAGILNINGYDIDLLSSGRLINETNASRITGTNGGKVKITEALNAPAAANPGNLVLYLLPQKILVLLLFNAVTSRK